MTQYIQLALGADGSKLAADEISGVHHQYGKLQIGPVGTATDVSDANPVPTKNLVEDALPLFGYIDTSFVTGDSPVTHDINTDLTRNARDIWIKNDGAGNFTFALSFNGSAWSGEVVMKSGEEREFRGLSIDSIRITWVADSSYRITAI
ncbi:MAG: hypothetical protein OSB57_04140 [Planctomycetota bacterium]|nr:hypothetical protein [Planctomycetota bacterium]